MTGHRAAQGRAVAVVAVAVVALATATVLAGCGIPSDGEPREISRDALPPELVEPDTTGTSLPGEVATRMATLYLARPGAGGSGDALVAVTVQIPRPASPDDLPRILAEAVIAARPDQLGRSDLVNALPSDAQVRSAVVGDDGVLDLDLTNLGNVESMLQRLAVAQLVLTLTDPVVPRIDAVRFSVDGEQVSVPIEGGVAPAGTPVGRDDEPPVPTGS